MKKILFVCLCCISLLVCNIQTVFGATGHNVVTTEFGSYTYDTEYYHTDSIAELNLALVTIPLGGSGQVYTIDFQFYHYYKGTVQIKFTQNIGTNYFEWYLSGDGAVFQNGFQNNTAYIGINGCNHFTFTIIWLSGAQNSFSQDSVSFSYLDSSTNTWETGLENVDDSVDISNIVSRIDNGVENIDSALDDVNSNLDSIETYVSNIDTNVASIGGQILTNLSTSISTLSSINERLNLLNGYVDNVETYLANVNQYIQMIYNRLNVCTGYVNEIKGSVDGLEDLLTTLNTSVSALQNTRFQVQDLEMPFYQYLFFSVLTRSNMSLVHYDESNVPYVQWSEVKDLVMQINVTSSSNIEFCYYVNNSAVNRITVDGSFGTYDRGLGSATRFANHSKFSVTTGSHNISFGRSDGSSNGVVPDSCRIYPIYMGYQGFVPREIALLFNLNTIDDSIYETLVDIYTTLSNIDTSSSNSALIQALEDLRTAISGFQNQVTINNTISVNSHDLPIYQYVFLTMLTRNDVNLVHFDESGEPYVLWSEVKNNTFTFNPGTGTSNQILAYYSTDANLILSIDNETLTRNRGVGSSVRFSNYYLKELSFGNHTVTFSKSNNTAIADVVRIYPIYMGRADCLPEIMGTVFGLETTANQYSLILNSLNALAANIDLNFGVYSAEMTAQIDALVVAMDSLLEFNLNIDSLFDKLFEINFDDLFDVDINIDLKVLDDMLLNIGSILGGNIEDVVDYHDIWLQQYDLLDLDTKLTVPQEIQSGANALGNMFEQIVASDSTIGFITYSSLSIGLFGLYLGLRREKK